jgi:hypothetical protein
MIMDNDETPNSEIILYQTEDGRTRIQCRFENETIWLTQALVAELFQVTPQNVTLHLKSIYKDGELDELATCKDFLKVRSEGGREVSRKLRHYNLAAILAVGYRVRSHRGTQFRQWATARLSEYLMKGFAMDDERLKNPPGKGHKDYFDELLERIRDIRSSKRRFYQKNYSTSTLPVLTTRPKPKCPKSSLQRSKTKCIGPRMVKQQTAFRFRRARLGGAHN